MVDGPVPGRVVPFNAPGTEQGICICGRVRLDWGFRTVPVCRYGRDMALLRSGGRTGEGDVPDNRDVWLDSGAFRGTAHGLPGTEDRGTSDCAVVGQVQTRIRVRGRARGCVPGNEDPVLPVASNRDVPGALYPVRRGDGGAVAGLSPGLNPGV